MYWPARALRVAANRERSAGSRVRVASLSPSWIPVRPPGRKSSSASGLWRRNSRPWGRRLLSLSPRTPATRAPMVSIGIPPSDVILSTSMKTCPICDPSFLRPSVIRVAISGLVRNDTPRSSVTPFGREPVRREKNFSASQLLTSSRSSAVNPTSCTNCTEPLGVLMSPRSGSSMKPRAVWVVSSSGTIGPLASMC